MRKIFTFTLFLALLLGAAIPVQAQRGFKVVQSLLDVKVSVVDARGVPQPDVVVVVSVESGNTGKWLHRQGSTNTYGSTIVTLEGPQFLKRNAVIAVLDRKGRQLFNTEARITGQGQRIRVEME